MAFDLAHYRQERRALIPQSVELYYFPLPKHHLFTAKEFPGISQANVDLTIALDSFLSVLTVQVRQQYGIGVTYGTEEEKETLLDFINWRKDSVGPHGTPQILCIKYLLRMVQ